MNGVRAIITRRAARQATAALAAGLAACSMGLSCDSNAQAAFRAEATSAIGSGVKTILNGVVDGLVAAIEQAGDGGKSSGSATSGSSSSGSSTR